jgi:hypothetical protein
MDKGWMDFPELGHMKGIRTKIFKRIMKSRKIRIQPLCGEYPSWVRIYPLRRRIMHIIPFV